MFMLSKTVNLCQSTAINCLDVQMPWLKYVFMSLFLVIYAYLNKPSRLSYIYKKKDASRARENTPTKKNSIVRPIVIAVIAIVTIEIVVCSNPIETLYQSYRNLRPTFWDILL